MEIIQTKSPKEEAGDKLSKVLQEHKDIPVLLMLSGGSALTILDLISPNALGSNITVTMLDERYSPDPTINNFSQFKQTSFYLTCIKQGVHVISTQVTENERIEELQNRIDLALHNWADQHKDGVIVVTMGIGSDGHTAGIFPGDYGIDFNGPDWVVNYSVPEYINTYTDRVTVTNTFLREKVDKAILLISGEDKADIVTELSVSNQLHNHLSGKPMDVLLQMKEVTLYTNLVS